MSARILDPISGQIVSRKEIEALIDTILQDRKKAVELCERCGESRRFLGWPFCWECGIKLLAKGTTVLDRWELLAGHKGDYKHSSFVGANLDFNFKNQIFYGRAFKYCDFSDAHFSNVDFSRCKFVSVNFTSATFNKCTFRRASFEECIFRCAKFEQSDFEKSKLSTLELVRCLFTSKTILSNCRFENTELFETYFDTCLLRHTQFMGKSTITRADFANCDLARSDLTCVDIDRLSIRGPDTNVAGMRLMIKQKKDVQFSEGVDTGKMDFTLLPTWSLARKSRPSFAQNLLIRDICHGVTETVGIAIHSIAAGILAGLIYSLIFATFESKSFMWSFIKASGVFSAFLLGVAIYALINLSRLRKKQLARSRYE